MAVSDSYDACVRLMREAISLHIDSVRRHGDPIPLPSTVGVLTIDAAWAGERHPLIWPETQSGTLA